MLTLIQYRAKYLKGEVGNRTYNGIYDFKKYGKVRIKVPNKLPLFDFYEELGVPFPHLIYKGNMLEEKTVSVPVNYCLKPVNGAGARGVFLMKGEYNISENRHYGSFAEIRSRYLEWSKVFIGYSMDFYIEELLLNSKGCIPADYKLHCFGNKIAFICATNRFPKSEYGNRVYDDQGNLVFENGKKMEELSLPMSEFQKFVDKVQGVLRLEYLRIDVFVKDSEIYGGELGIGTGTKNDPFTLLLDDIDSVEKNIYLRYMGYIWEYTTSGKD